MSATDGRAAPPPAVGFSWRASPPPDCTEISLAVEVRSHASGLHSALSRPPKVTALETPLAGERPGVVSLMLSGPAITTCGFRFADDPASAAAWRPKIDAARATLRDRSPRPAPRPKSTTRLRPPSDIVKLEDRLRYVLQPPLETWLAGVELEFPFEPFPYQFEGMAFLYPRHGAVLADEMGLGKTMQAITAIRLLLHARELKSVLLVCPKPLVTNWRNEFALWAPELEPMIIEGDQARRGWQWSLPAQPVRIANYELVQRDRALFEQQGLHFDLVVLDESQRIKNRASVTSEVIRSISRRRSWALTGTPVENSVHDLVGIFEFLSPGYLSAEMKPRKLGRLAGDYVLRRTKDMVLADLPPKLVRDADVQLTPAQRETYRLAEDEGVLRLTAMGDSAAIQHVFELVLRLKQICNFDPATGESSKLERLEADLEEVAASGQKAIIFSQWVNTLTLLAERLRRFGPLEYHGRVPSRSRDAVIERFKQDANSHVLLMSYGAGGVGLNLQFASYVFLFDRWWNPAVEDQAVNRAHRIGVERPVTITRFLAAHTIEERIDQVLQEKRELFDTIFSGVGAPSKTGLTQEEMFGLFRLKSPQRDRSTTGGEKTERRGAA